jgi:hypothetical protein
MVYMCNYNKKKYQRCDLFEFQKAWKKADDKCGSDQAARSGLFNGYDDAVPDHSYGRGVTGDAICGYNMKGSSSSKDNYGTFGSG